MAKASINQSTKDRLRVRDERDVCYFQDSSLAELVRDAEALMASYGRDAEFQIDWEDARLYIVFYRDETDAEYKRRQKQVAQRRAKSKKIRETAAEKEYKEYQRLCKKYQVAGYLGDVS